MKFKGFKYTFRINASHKTHGDAINAHYHTFEIALFIQQSEQHFISFSEIEHILNSHLNIYSGKLLNDIYPFDEIVPTIENMGEYFFVSFSKLLNKNGFILFRLDISETPNRIYTIKEHEISDRQKEVFLELAHNFEHDFIINDNSKSEIKKSPILITKPTEDKDEVMTKEEKAPATPLTASNKSFISSVLFIIACGFFVMIAVKISGVYTLGYDIHGHLFKADLMYNEICEGNFYPLYTEYWYNGLQPYRYWPPMPYYFMSLLQFISGGSVIGAYLGFIWASFSIGGLGWVLLGKKLNRPVLGAFFGIAWFFLPDNLRVYFGEGNMPRMFITMLIPLIFYCIWQLVEYRRKKMVFPLIVLMLFAITGHLMISAMIGVGSFIFLLIYSISNKRAYESVYTILAMLLSFAVAGIWVYPSLVGGLTSMSEGGTSELMASLAEKLTVSLNPFLRLDGEVTELYFGLSIAVITIIGLVLSNKKSLPGFCSMLIVMMATTTALTPIIQKIPFSQLFWVRRFTPIAYAMFVIAVLEWKKLKKPLLITMCVVIALDCVPSIALNYYDVKMNIPATEQDMKQSMDDYLFSLAKEITKNRVNLMDLSTYGPMPSYAFGTLAPKTQYVFGWAWQGASTASNIVALNESFESRNYDYLFDRSIELGADSVIINKAQVPEDYINSLYDSANRTGYSIADESQHAWLFSLNVDGTFGVITNYQGLAIGSTAALVPQIMPYFGVGDKLYIDDYSVEELSVYKKIYLSGFFYNDKSYAENLIKDLAEKGVEIYIDMNRIPADPLTNRMTFLDVSAQPITFYNKFYDLITDDEVLKTEDFVDEYSEWNTVYLTQLDDSLGYSWFEDTKLDFIGKKGNENITFLGFNILYHAITADDEVVYNLLNEIMDLDENDLPIRTIVPIEIIHENNKITINCDYDDVNTTLAYNDIFESKSEIESVNNLLVVNKGTTVITMKYPYFKQGLIVSIFGIMAEAFILFLFFKRGNIRKTT